MQAFRAKLSDKFDKLSPGLRKVTGNMGWLFIDRIVRMGMGLVVGVWTARYLGPGDFGIFNFGIAFVALFATATTLGLESIIVRELLEKPEHAREILGTSIVLRALSGLLSMFLVVGAVKLLQPQDHLAILIVAILSPQLLFQAFDTIDSFFQSEVRSKITVWAKNGAFLICAGVKVILILLHAPLWAFAVATSGEFGLGAVGLVIGYRVAGGHLAQWKVSRARAKALIQQSWPIIFSAMAIMVYMRLDMIMLKVMKGDAAVGLYSAATRISEVWYFIPAAVVSSVQPSIIRVKNDPVLFYERQRKLFSLMTVTACLIGSVVALLSNTIVRLLYSHSYAGAGPVLAAHVWASVFVFLGVAQSPWNIAHNLLKQSLYHTIAGAVINVVMNLYLIPRYSVMGAALATVVSYAISSVFANAFSASMRPIFYMQMRSFLPTRFWKHDIPG